MSVGKYLQSLILAGSFFALAVSPARAYRIESFVSEINIARDTSVHITEKIQAVFDTPKHGIIRTIPVIYRTDRENVNSRVSGVSVTDTSGNPVRYSITKSGTGLEIKIGDPDRTVTGSQTYVISYTAKNILRRYQGYDELYWNVVGSGWDADILTASAKITSPHASVTMSDCFGNCRLAKIGDSAWQVVSTAPVPPGSDLTFVLGFDPQNRFIFPDPGLVFWQDEGVWILLIFIPAVIMAVSWWRRGRDDKFIGANVYFQDPGAVTAKVNPLDRQHLPMVYSPVKGLTPAESGTILDMRVDLGDVVAEISELARLKYISIHKISTKRIFLPDSDDYIFAKVPKTDLSALKPHQRQLLDSLFKSLYRPDSSTLAKLPVSENIIAESSAQLSKMSGHFYTDLAVFRDKLYSGLTSAGYFGGRPDHLQGGGIAAAVLLTVICTFLANSFSLSRMIWPWGFVSGLIAVWFGYGMGYRTARGHALYRQLTGLKYFIGKGKWRYEIAEKNLFIEEILPLAVSLGVVDKLTRDMQSLQIAPPKYLGNMTPVEFARFGGGIGRSLAATPSGSSSRGWSGGSGFSGGSSGGGFGGGGGRSW